MERAMEERAPERGASVERCVLVVCVLAAAGMAACDGASSMPREDGGIVVHDGSLTDAGEPPDAGVTDGSRPDAGSGGDSGGPESCSSHGECEDGDRCTEDTCLEGRCVRERIEDCEVCSSDADCDDGFRCTIDTCWGTRCGHEWSSAECDCRTDANCDDFDSSTEDRCVDYECVHEPVTCSGDAECDDGDSCTVDSCVSGTCQHTTDPGCSSCPDRDGDGHGSSYCFGGDDCDDADPSVHPGATEICDDGADNDCDGAVDAVDDDCSTGGETCETARALEPGTPVEGAIIWDESSGEEMDPCGASNFFTLEIAETSDVEITVTLEDPPPPEPVPGCPECTSDHEWEYWYRLFLETSCGDTTTDLGGGGSWCNTYASDGWFGGSNSNTLSARRVPAGTYTVELQASDFFAWMPVAIEYTLEASVTPSDEPACEASTELTEGATTSGSTGSGTDAFGLDCDGSIVEAEEALHSFTLDERRRVRLETVSLPPSEESSAPGLQVAAHGACDPEAERLACLEHSGRECYARTTLEEILDAGTHWVTVESRSGGEASYDITLETEAVGAACMGATTIDASTSVGGHTTGNADAFRDAEVCGGGYGPDAVHRVEVSEPSRVVLDLVASYEDEMLTLYRGCGEERLAGGGRDIHVDTELEPGTYYAVVGGRDEGDHGDFVLNATIVPSGS